MIDRIIINTLIEKSGIRPGDSVWTEQVLPGQMEHFVIYLGMDDFDSHWMVAQFETGVRLLSYPQIAQLIKMAKNTKLNHFVGSEEMRTKAVDRMYERMDSATFLLILRNSKIHKEEVKRANEGFQWDRVKRDVGIGLGILGAFGLAAAAWKWWIENDKK